MVSSETSAPSSSARPLEIGSNTVAGTAGRKFRIAGDVVGRAIQELPDDERALVWWLYQFCYKRDFTSDEIGRLLKKPTGDFYSGDSVVQLFSGGRIRRGENIQPLLAAIKTLKSVEDKRAALVKSGFVETSLYQEVERRINHARLRQRILFIFGDSQIGKTEATVEYKRRHNHGQTIYIECPTGGRIGDFLQALGRELHITYFANVTQLAERIIDAFDPNMMLICDEMHRCLKRGSVSGLEVFSFLRELWNRRKCGQVICMTNEGRDNFLTGPHAKALQQIWRRRITPLQLPSVPPAHDLALFAAAYGLPPATMEPVTISVSYVDDNGKTTRRNHTASPLKVQTDLVTAEGLGVWISILQDAADMASEQSKAITWGAVIKAHCQSQADAQILS